MLRKKSGKHLCQSLFFNKVAGLKDLCQSLFFHKVTGLQLNQKRGSGTMFSCEFCEISKNTFFHRTPLVAASGYFVCDVR